MSKNLKKPFYYSFLLLLLPFALSANATTDEPINPNKDYHSYANIDEVVMTHIDFDLAADFDKNQLSGSVELTLKYLQPEAKELILDTKALDIQKVERLVNDTYQDANWKLGETDATLGTPLVIQLEDKTEKVKVHYATTDASDGLNWAAPEQTSDKKHPFMYSLSQTIYGRTWFPHQDTPAIRVTYNANITTPENLLALMSADNDPKTERDGNYQFTMPQPIVPYLIAIAVGDFSFHEISDRSGIYAESSVLKKAAWEFGNTEDMIEKTEGMYGDYAWGRYDLLVMPPSFPFGGMEHARLSFITPTVITGDRGLVQLISHELAHSWSGNYVTNRTWRDLWLNEGFTKYVENRVIESVFGKERANMELVISMHEVEENLVSLEPQAQILAIDLRGQHPDAVFTHIPYAKAQLFLVFLEQRVGRDTFDKFVNTYFTDFAWSTLSTEEFETYLYATLLRENPQAFTKEEVKQWIYEPGYPDFGPKPQAKAYEIVDEKLKAFIAGEIQAQDIGFDEWMIHQKTHFINSLPSDIAADKLAALDDAGNLSDNQNIKLAYTWMLYCSKAGYQKALDQRLEKLLTEQGRIAFTKGLYKTLLEHNAQLATDIYKKAKPGYHPITVWEVDRVFKAHNEKKASL